MSLEDDKRLLAQLRTQLDAYYTTATSSNSEGGVNISENEQRTITAYQTRIDRLNTAIEAAEEEERTSGGSTSSQPISYSKFANRTWSWELVDEDTLSEDDFGASLDINFKFGLEERNNVGYWILEQVILNPNTLTGLKLEVTKVITKYYELNGSLAMLIEFQFLITTADITITHSAGASLSLGTDVKNTIGVALPVEGAEVSAGSERGVSTGLNASYEFTKSSVLPGSRATVSRSFLCVNKPGSELEISADVRLDARETAIGDPGMDFFWGDSADWKITTNDSSFVGSLS